MPQPRPSLLPGPFELHISRAARERYGVDDGLFSFNGNVVFASFHAARLLAQRINEIRRLEHQEGWVEAGQINAMGLIDEILHLVLARYRQQREPALMARALEHLESELGQAEVDRLLLAFVEQFPPVAVHRGSLSAAEYLQGATAGLSHREVSLEEMLLLWLANLNPAFEPFRDLFDDQTLRRSTVYEQAMEQLAQALDERAAPAGGSLTLLQMLRAPALASPHSLEGQLDYIRTHWMAIVGDVLARVLSSLDMIAEEHRPYYGPGPGPQEPPDLSTLSEAPEAYSTDLHWMPRLVLLAKNAYVWLDQLSRRHGEPITRLDQVPDSELDRLARWGITGLWLIGLWQRSSASQRIKQRMGNPEAVASAYSIDEYRVADDLGGDVAFDQLKARAWRRGIRMSSDMVPNHVGIDSRWVIEHPDWFIGLDYSPFPAYSFSGPDLSDDGRVGIYLEDHYWDRSDAAVVFKRVDHWTGAARYIYHGNDGTSMPWNDTAQLDYRNPEVREAVIQTILDVARRSPIIRFDAAMTLTKQHYQRLWFPEPGTGGDIPSRAEHAMTRAQLDEVMPRELWREVVDRVAESAPDTLLLAEAFWLLEGYFVRSLGMHRVYNSAFMNMLRDEKNSEYRQLIRSTLEFDPQILKRYVNFMSNPDERTAIDQFGTGDKYFGVCTLMVTMPGLPMIGHGQIEGFAEKYGMEYRRAYWDEEADRGLIERHERQVFPLMHRRYLFAEVEHFLMYDFQLGDGSVDENVFAYSNGTGPERALVLYHNRFAETRGWVRTSTSVAARGADGERILVRRSLADGLGLNRGAATHMIFRDAVSGLEYIRSCRQIAESGLWAELAAYQLQVFTDLRQVEDDSTGRYARVEAALGGEGVPSIDEAVAELVLAPVLEPFSALTAPVRLEQLREMLTGSLPEPRRQGWLAETARLVDTLAAAVLEVGDGDGEAALLGRRVTADLQALLLLAGEAAPAPAPKAKPSASEAAPVKKAIEGAGPEELPQLVARLLALDEAPGLLLSWAVTRSLGRLLDASGPIERARIWVDEWLIGTTLARSLGRAGLDEARAQRVARLLGVTVGLQSWWQLEDGTVRDAGALLELLLADRAACAVIGVNLHRGVLWFHKESYDELLDWLRLLTRAELLAAGDPETVADQADQILCRLAQAEATAGYRVEGLREAVNGPEHPGQLPS